MKVRDERRKAAVGKMADFLLSEGLGAASLRPLAAAAGISDRMLLYYFKDRDEILTVTLHYFAERMLIQLDEAVPAGKPRSFRELLNEVGVVVARPEVRRSMHLWLDLAAGASRGVEPHVHLAGEIADRFLAWIGSRLEPAGPIGPSAALFLTLLEGMHVLEACGRSGIGSAAAEEVAASFPVPNP